MNKIIALALLSLAGTACSGDRGGRAAAAAPAPAPAPVAIVTGQAPVHPGKAVFDKWCAICHDRGERMAGTASLQAKYEGAIPAALEDREDMAPEFIRYFVRNGVMIMPAFRKTEVSDADLALLTDYLSQKKAP